MRLFFLLAGLRISPHGLKERQERKQKDRGGRAEAEGQSRYGGICSRMTAFGVRWLFFVHICKKNRYSAGKVCIQFALRNKKSIVYCIRTREKRTTQNLKGGSPQYLSLRKHFPDDGSIRRNPVLQGAGKLFYVQLIRNAKKQTSLTEDAATHHPTCGQAAEKVIFFDQIFRITKKW